MLGRSTYHYATVLPPIENCPLNHVLGRAVDFTFGYTMTQKYIFSSKSTRYTAEGDICQGLLKCRPPYALGTNDIECQMKICSIKCYTIHMKVIRTPCSQKLFNKR